jgi:hypothetical protein
MMSVPQVWLMGFQGATRAGYHLFRDTDPLLLTGHVGVSLDGGTTIFGFSPYAPLLSPQTVIDALAAGRTFPGMVRDDRELFVRAVSAAARGYTRTPVYLWAQEILDADWAAVARRLQSARDASPETTTPYSWPSVPENGYNCATWPRTLGIAIPETSGRLARYIPALRHAAGGRIYAG